MFKLYFIQLRFTDSHFTSCYQVSEVDLILAYICKKQHKYYKTKPLTNRDTADRSNGHNAENIGWVANSAFPISECQRQQKCIPYAIYENNVINFSHYHL